MTNVTIVIREVGSLKPDYSLDFELPSVPEVGSYISVQRPDRPAPYSEDLIVRKVWWTLHHPETRAIVDKMSKGSLVDVIVECDQAIGPYSSDSWREQIEAARERGIDIEEFELARYSVRQDNSD